MNVRDFVVGSLATQRARKKLARERVTRCEPGQSDKRVKTTASTKRPEKRLPSRRSRER